MLNRYRIISIVHCVSGLLCEYGLIERQLVCWLIDWLTGRWLCDDVITLQHDGNLYIIFVVVTLLLSLYTPHEDRKLSRWSFCYHLTQLSWVRDYWAIKQVQVCFVLKSCKLHIRWCVILPVRWTVPLCGISRHYSTTSWWRLREWVLC